MRSDDTGRVAVEGDDDGDALTLFGVGDGLSDDLLMAEMNAIEGADCRADLAVGGGQIAGGTEEFHEGLLS
jgi:hypothetical protein